MPHRSGRRPKSRSLPDARPLLFACAGSISLMTRTVDDIVVLLHGSPPAGIRSTDARGRWRLGERFSHVQARWFGDRLGATSFCGLMDWFCSLVVVCLQWGRNQAVDLSNERDRVPRGRHHGAVDQRLLTRPKKASPERSNVYVYTSPSTTRRCSCTQNPGPQTTAVRTWVGCRWHSKVEIERALAFLTCMHES
jgi:hypothetical protein